ncbi:hypothetical protein D3C77_655460 [compost metagenome]
MNHFALARLALQIKQRMGEHFAQALEPTGKCCLWDFEKVVSSALAGACIDLPAVTLHIAHQAIVEGEAVIAEKQQVLKKVGQARMSTWGVMTACHHPYRGGAALELRGMA